MPEDEIRRYQVPTHLKVEDQLTIGCFTFTFRQLAVLVLGGSAAYEVWNKFPVAALAALLGTPLATGVNVSSVGLLVLLTLALALVRRRGRTLETWFFVWLRYAVLPRGYRWRRQPDSALGQGTAPAPPAAESEDA